MWRAQVDATKELTGKGNVVAVVGIRTIGRPGA